MNKQQLDEVVPEKKDLLMAAKINSIAWGHQIEGYNDAITTITDKRRELGI